MHEQFVEPARRTADIVMHWRQDPAAQAQRVIDAIRARRDGAPLETSS